MNLQAIRRRIGSVKSTQKITRAMKMVAAAKLRRAQDALRRTRPYAQSMRELTMALAAHADPTTHPLLRHGNGDVVGLVVITSDRGLCGGFNANIINETMRQVRNQFAGRKVELVVVGRRGIESFKRRPVKMVRRFPGVFDKFSIGSSALIVDEVVKRFTEGEFSEVHCIYNEFKSTVSQKVIVERLLPYTVPEETTASSTDYIFEPSEEELLFTLLVNNIYAQMYRILHESMASEHGARMSSMDAATRNSSEILETLTLTYNRARQDAITKEVTEVISAAEAV